MTSVEIGRQLQCEMRAECTEPVTHIEEKGWIYCKSHAAGRKSSGHYCRELRPWELRLLKAGKPVPSYTPISLAAHDVFGIRRHLNRDTGELMDFFLPRYSARS